MRRPSAARGGAEPSISVVVPVRDEAPNLRLLFAEVRAVLDALERPAELVFVDDGSADDSADVIRALQRLDARVRLVCFVRPAGLSAALLAGFRAARGEVVVTLDADLQNDPRDIPNILAALEHADVVVGWRSHRHDPWHRRISSAVANRIRNAVTGGRIRDSGCGLRALRRRCVDDVVAFDGMHRFLPTLLGAAGHRVAEVPVNHRPRRFGRAHFGIRNRALVTLRDLLGVRWLLSRQLAYEAVEDPASEPSRSRRARVAATSHHGDPQRVAMRLAAFWLVATMLVVGAPFVTGRGDVRDLPPATRDVMLFPERPAGRVLAIDVGWDAPPGSDGWIVLEGAMVRSESDAMSWRRRLHHGWNAATWEITDLPAEEVVRLRLASPTDAAWRISSPRIDDGYRLHHLMPLRGLLFGLGLAAALVVAQVVTAAVVPRARTALRWWLALGGIAGIALGLRLHTLALQSLWFDEVLTAIGARDLAWVLHTPQIFGHPPLHYLTVWALGGGAADEWWLRLPSCVAGVATVVALAALGRALLGPVTGLAAALVLALSPFHVELSQLARPYALFLLLTVLSLMALVPAVERNRARDWLWFSALVTLNLYTHYLAAQVLALQVAMTVVLLVRARGRGTLAALLSFAGAGALLLPWAPVIARLSQAQIGRGEVSATAFHELVVTVFVPQFLGPGLGSAIGLSLVAGALWALRGRADLALITLLWLVVPPLVFWWAQPAHFIAGRHLAFALPMIMLLLGHGIVAAAGIAAWTARALGVRNGVLPPLGAALAASIFIFAWSAPAAAVLRQYYHVRHGIDWRSVVSVLDQAIGDDDRVVATTGALYPLRHYWSLRVEDVSAAGFPAKPVRDARRSWVVVHNGWDRPAELGPWLETYAVKVGELPASWSVPGLALYRLRRAARAL